MEHKTTIDHALLVPKEREKGKKAIGKPIKSTRRDSNNNLFISGTTCFKGEIGGCTRVLCFYWWLRESSVFKLASFVDNCHNWCRMSLNQAPLLSIVCCNFLLFLSREENYALARTLLYPKLFWLVDTGWGNLMFVKLYQIAFEWY